MTPINPIGAFFTVILGTLKPDECVTISVCPANNKQVPRVLVACHGRPPRRVGNLTEVTTDYDLACQIHDLIADSRFRGSNREFVADLVGRDTVLDWLGRGCEALRDGERVTFDLSAKSNFGPRLAVIVTKVGPNSFRGGMQKIHTPRSVMFDLTDNAINASICSRLRAVREKAKMHQPVPRIDGNTINVTAEEYDQLRRMCRRPHGSLAAKPRRVFRDIASLLGITVADLAPARTTDMTIRAVPAVDTAVNAPQPQPMDKIAAAACSKLVHEYAMECVWPHDAVKVFRDKLANLRAAVPATDRAEPRSENYAEAPKAAVVDDIEAERPEQPMPFKDQVITSYKQMRLDLEQWLKCQANDSAILQPGIAAYRTVLRRLNSLEATRRKAMQVAHARTPKDDTVSRRSFEDANKRIVELTECNKEVADKLTNAENNVYALRKTLAKNELATASLWDQLADANQFSKQQTERLGLAHRTIERQRSSIESLRRTGTELGQQVRAATARADAYHRIALRMERWLKDCKKGTDNDFWASAALQELARYWDDCKTTLKQFTEPAGK